MCAGVFGLQVGIALFGLRSGNLDGAARIGLAVACSAFGLLPYAITMLQLRVFYAMTDSRTPALIQLFTVAVKIPLLLVCPLVLPPREVVLVGLRLLRVRELDPLFRRIERLVDRADHRRGTPS